MRLVPGQKNQLLVCLLEMKHMGVSLVPPFLRNHRLVAMGTLQGAPHPPAGNLACCLGDQRLSLVSVVPNTRDLEQDCVGLVAALHGFTYVYEAVDASGLLESSLWTRGQKLFVTF